VDSSKARDTVVQRSGSVTENGFLQFKEPEQKSEQRFIQIPNQVIENGINFRTRMRKPQLRKAFNELHQNFEKY
jgi:hypothetical protein